MMKLHLLVQMHISSQIFHSVLDKLSHKACQFFTVALTRLHLPHAVVMRLLHVTFLLFQASDSAAHPVRWGCLFGLYVLVYMLA